MLLYALARLEASLQELHVVLHTCTRAGRAQRRRERSQVAARFAVGAQRGFSNFARVKSALILRLDSLGPTDALGLGGFLRVSQFGAAVPKQRHAPKCPLLPRRCVASLRCSVTPLAARAACCVPSLQPWLRLALPWPARSPACLPAPPAVILRNQPSGSLAVAAAAQAHTHTTPAEAQHSTQSRASSPAALLPKPLSRSASPCLFRCPRCVCISRPSRGNPSSVQSPLVAQSQPRSRFPPGVPPSDPLCIFRLPRRSLLCLDPWHCPPRRPSSLARLCPLLHPDQPARPAAASLPRTDHLPSPTFHPHRILPPALCSASQTYRVAAASTHDSFRASPDLGASLNAELRLRLIVHETRSGTSSPQR